MLRIEAVDLSRIVRFWNHLHLDTPKQFVLAETPAMRVVAQPLIRSVEDEAAFLVTQGAEIVGEFEDGLLMRDPEGNPFLLEPNPDLHLLDDDGPERAEP
ncbi:hypothetical protein K7472_27400 [Streptomyces sp. PTM05]|uniref:Glyoxalase-like domain-containing protein n=1 Tax=Streptantibioticus parmotrematis TaxID=2873249 RepID=A0ABS7R1V5_9ACTN|nr:hypothetical protein [Streptantibioticus parmotrematis]MBY8888540.1 hypothetical protein [Streptantibioticus parmotrematis]